MKNNGVLTYTGLEDDFADELALDLDEEPDNVKITLAYLLSCGLAESSDNVNFFFPWAVANTGSETDSAERMRKMRANGPTLPTAEKKPPKTPAERQRAFRAKQNCEQRQHIPMVDDYSNQKRYNGNYYLVCQREKYKCAICESTENLCVHHIDGYDEGKPENSDLNKMVLLCRKCHSNVHAGTPIPQEVLDSIEYEDSNVTKPVTRSLRNGYVEKEEEKNLYSEKKEKPETENSSFQQSFQHESDFEKKREEALRRLEG
jgi:hypothetical protein